MNEGRGNCHNPLDGNHHTAVTFDTDKLTLNSLEDATGDTDTISLLHGNGRRVQINNLFIVITGNSNKTTHLDFRNGNGLTGLTVHDITNRERSPDSGFHFVNLTAGGINKNQVVNNRNKFADLTLTTEYVFVAHGKKILHSTGVQVFLKGKLTAIGDTKGVPGFINAVVHERI